MSGGSQLAALRDNPDALYGALAAIANGGVSEAALEAAKELARTEQSLRSAVLYAVLALRAGQLAEAEAVLRAAEGKHGEHPALLLNLAKIAQKRGDDTTALATGRRALLLAPNDELTMGWWASLMRLANRDGELLGALEVLSGRPGAWRPQLQLAEYYLEKQSYADAERCFVRALDAATNARPCIELVARDLRATDQHEAMTRLLAPRWQLSAHGPYVALAIARAHFSLGQLGEGDALLEQARAHLSADAAGFVGQLEALRAARLAAAAKPAALKSVPITAAIWAGAAPSLLPARSRERLIAFAQLADCTMKHTPDAAPNVQPVTELEAACRAIPLWWTEGVTLGTDATGQALIATVADQGLATFTEHLELQAALPLASPKTPPRVLVTGFFSLTVTSELQLDLIAHDLTGGAAKALSVSVSKGTPASLAARAERDLLRQLERAGHLTAAPAPVLSRPELDADLLRLLHETLVGVLTASKRIDPKLRWGGGKTLDLALELAARDAQADTPALLALVALAAARDRSRAAEVRAAMSARPKLASVKVPA